VSKKQAATTHRINAVLVRHSGAERRGRLRHQGKLAVGVTRSRDRLIFSGLARYEWMMPRAGLHHACHRVQLLTGRMTMRRTVARAYYHPRPLFDREAGNIDLAPAKYRCVRTSVETPNGSGRYLIARSTSSSGTGNCGFPSHPSQGNLLRLAAALLRLRRLERDGCGTQIPLNGSRLGPPTYGLASATANHINLCPNLVTGLCSVLYRHQGMVVAAGHKFTPSLWSATIFWAPFAVLGSSKNSLGRERRGQKTKSEQ
jgi:hypothetical protein